MKIKVLLKRFGMLMLTIVMGIQLISCGTLLYPERQGKRSGEVDMHVVIMDAIGLVFGVIPGVVAFAVDYHTGAIYLPKGHPRGRGKNRQRTEREGLIVLKVDPRSLSHETISDLITEEMGFAVRMKDPRLIIKEAQGKVDIALELKRLSQQYR